MDKTFGMISLGCDKNRVDGERLLGEIVRHGGRITTDPAKAQILIVNTCAFLNASREESITAVLEANGYRENGVLEKLVVTGCLPQKFIKELFPALTEADVFLGTGDAEQLLAAIEESYGGKRVNAVGTGGEARSPRLVSTPDYYKYLKIAEGCFHHCTYCLIPKIRGKYRSVPMEELLEEAKSLGQTQELILVAQDTTRYYEDFGENKFVELIKNLSKLDNICHIRLLYCYPEMITDELISEVKNNPKVLKYLDIPLQHSEDRILKLMGRRGTRAEYLALIRKLKREIPQIALRSTFIAGFPSETEEEAESLNGFLREAELTNCGFFAYSREKDTPAYRMAGQIPARVKARRVKALYRTQREISKKLLSRFVGQTLPVLTCGIAPEGGFWGRAYFEAPEVDGVVYFQAKQAEEGKLRSVKITRATDYDLYGTSEETK